MPTIEELELQINATAQQANSRITALSKKLDVLSTSLKKIESININSTTAAIQQLSSAVGAMKGVSTKKFEDIANGINAISKVSVNPQKYADLSNSLTQLSTGLSSLKGVSSNVTGFVDATARLANAGQNIAITTGVMPKFSANLQQVMAQLSQAPTIAQGTINFTNALASLANTGAKLGTVSKNLSTFGTELSKVITTLSKSPQVSSNTIQLTNALANLASQSSKVGTASKELVSGLNKTHTASSKASKSATSLAAAFGKFYASYFLVVRGIKSLWSSIEGTADYIEAYNYYNVAFGKIASEWDKDWQKYGYENAEVYAESFTDRMNKSLSKLSGIQIDTDTGLLSTTGIKNLGLNIQEVTQYASQLASVTNSVGQTGEVSLAAANAFTKLGADMSSLFNIDYSTAMNNLQSGLIGQSRALYKYGIDITNATLQTYAYELGLSKAISEMTQAEKMQLRMIAILDQSEGSWGDLANTINSPSNMMRQLTNNLEEAGMVLGQLFIPALQNLLPILNGVTIALKEMLVNLAQLLNINIDLSSFGQGFSNMEDSLDGIADGYEDAASSAKKWQNQLMGFDEINKLTDNASSTTGGGDNGTIDLTSEILKATSEYEKVWGKAYDAMESKAQDFANGITKSFTKIGNKFKPLQEPFDRLVKSLKGLSNFTFGALEEFYSNFLEPVGNWMINDDSGIARFLDIATRLNYNIDWDRLKQAVGDLSSVLATISVVSWDSLMKFYNNFLAPLTTWTLSSAIPTLADVLQRFATAVNWELFGDVIGEALSIASDIATSLGDAFLRIVENVWPKIAPIFNNLMSIFNTLLNDRIKPLWEFLKTYLLPIFEFSLTNSINTFLGVVKSITSTIDGVLKGITKLVTGVFTGDWEKAWEGVTGIFKSVFGGIKGIAESVWNGVLNIFNKGGKIFDGIVGSVADVFKDIVNAIIDGINKVIAIPFNNINSSLNAIRSTNILGFKPFKDAWSDNPIWVPEIPKFASGGFPEDGLFMANHNELVGQFSNGRTAVANNEQIISGIEAGVYNAVVAALANASNNNTNVTVVLEGDSAELFRVVQQEGRDYQRIYNREVFA